MTKMLDIFRALADPTRVRIVQLLRTMELSVGELAQVLAQSQPRVSRHIKILCDAGVAERRKEGSWVFLRSAVAENRAPPMGSAAARLLAVADDAIRRAGRDRDPLRAQLERRGVGIDADLVVLVEREPDALDGVHVRAFRFVGRRGRAPSPSMTVRIGARRSG